MLTLRSAHYSYNIIRSVRTDLPGPPELDCGLSEPISRPEARPPVPEWFFARVLFLLREIDPSCKLEDYLVFGSDFVHFPLDVRDVHGTLVATPFFALMKRDARWQGLARSYPIGKTAIGEFEGLLCAEPDRLAEYRLDLSWRGPLGWNGRRFRGQRAAKPAVPTRQAAPPRPIVVQREPSFQVEEILIAPGDPVHGHASRRRRFTDGLPPISTWRGIPNWRHAYDEEGRSGLDESTIKPCAEQRFIAEATDYTTGEAWLPNDRILPVFISINSQGIPHHLTCVGDTCVWEIPCRSEGFATSELTDEQRALFPLRVVSYLSRSVRDPGKTIRVIIDERGGITPWSPGE